MNGSSNAFRITPRLIIGLTILALGVLWTLDNMDYIESEPFTQYWPAVLIVIGLARLTDPRANRPGSVLLMIFGGFLLFVNLTNVHWDFGDLIPLGIALLGAKLVWDAIGRRRAPSAIDDPSSTVHAFAMMAGVHYQNTSQSFRGGDANAIMGGVELDLRNASIKEGEPAVIDAFAMWGGVEITVPENWRITGQVLPLLGGFDDKTTTSKTGGGPELIVKGAAVMGAIVVKN
jgi:predicted membrane protein